MMPLQVEVTISGLVRGPCRALVALAAILSGSTLAQPAAAAPELETFVLTAGGISGGTGCGTYSAPPPVSNRFGPAGLSIPTPRLAACGVAGYQNSIIDTAGPISDSSATSVSIVGLVYDGSSTAHARYGLVRASSHSNVTGIVGVRGGDGMAVARDDFTFTSPSVAKGANGTVTLFWTITGGLSNSGPGTNDTDMRCVYNVNGASPIGVMSSHAFLTTSPPSLSSTTDTIDGFTLTNGAISGSDELGSLAIPIVFGTPIAIQFALLADTVPFQGGVNDSELRVQLTGIEVRNSLDQILGDFAVSSSSGTAYGPEGLVLTGLPALPLPSLLGGALALAIASVGILGPRRPHLALPRRRRGDRRAA